MFGKEILRKKLNALQINKIKPENASGTYIVKVESSNGVFTQKVLIK